MQEQRKTKVNKNSTCKVMRIYKYNFYNTLQKLFSNN